MKRVSQVDAFLNEIGRTPLLTREQEITLFKHAKKGDKEAKEKIILANTRLVVSVAKQYIRAPSLSSSFLDLIQEGVVGLMEAVERFDPYRGTKFSTYAVPWIRKAIFDCLEKDQFIKYPRYLNVIHHKIATIEDGERGNTNKELAEILRVRPGTIEKARRIYRQPLSLDRPLKKREDENSTLLLEKITDPKIGSIEEGIKAEINREKLLKAIERLGQKEKEVVVLRYGFDGQGPLTLQEIGSRLGVTKERIRQILKRALKRLEKHLEEDCPEIKDAWKKGGI